MVIAICRRPRRRWTRCYAPNVGEGVNYVQPHIRGTGLAVTGLPVFAALLSFVPGTPGFGNVVFLCVAAAVSALGIWRTWHIGVEIGPDGVVVRNLIETVELRWQDIARVEYQRTKVLPRWRNGLHIFRLDGTSVECQAYPGGWNDDEKAVRSVMKALNRH